MSCWKKTFPPTIPCILHLSTFYPHMPLRAFCSEPSGQYNGATTKLHSGGGAYMIMCSVWYNSHKFNFGLIRSHTLLLADLSISKVSSGKL